MPQKVRRLWISCLVLSAAASASAQQPAGQAPQVGTTAAPAANSAQQKISRVRALIAARQFGAASNELEKLRKETSDESIQTIARTMLVSIYLEQPDYKRATDMLEEMFKRNKKDKKGIDQSYLAVAGQFIKGAGLQLERYKRLGINISDAALAGEAANDLDKWRGMLETVANQAKQLSVESKQPAEALALLEDAATARGTLARDEYETARWKNEINDTREMMANAQSKVAEVDENMNSTLVAASAPAGILNQPTNGNQSVPTQTRNQTVTRGASANTASVFEQQTPQVASGQNGVLSPVVVLPTEEKPLETTAGVSTTEKKVETPANQPSVGRQRVIAGANTTAKQNINAAPELTTAKANDGEPMKVGSLVDAATSKVNPTYPQIARTARIAGVVKVEVVLDEQGAVAEIRNTNGPQMLRRAAEDAVKRWKFKPFMRDGQPVRASGFVNFNFTL
jgi:TonB family protein